MKKPFAKRSLGQNYLVDPNHRRKIIEAVRRNYKGGDILEIGPGKGALTQGLIDFAERLVLVEKDVNFAEELASKFSANKNIRVVQGDFLEWNFSGLESERAMVVGNLPYNVSTQILIRLLQESARFSAFYLMFQKEVAGRCVALPGGKDYGILSVWVSLFTRARKLFDVPPSAFRPQPKVVSTVVEFLPNDQRYNSKLQSFIDFVKLVFSQRRKKISSLLRGRSEFNLEGLRNSSKWASYLDLRAEALSLDELRGLYENALLV